MVMRLIRSLEILKRRVFSIFFEGMIEFFTKGITKAVNHVCVARKSKRGRAHRPVLSNLRISLNLQSDASIRNRIFRIFDSNRRVEIRRFEFWIRIWVRSSRFGSDSVRGSVRMFEIRQHRLNPVLSIFFRIGCWSNYSLIPSYFWI